MKILACLALIIVVGCSSAAAPVAGTKVPATFVPAVAPTPEPMVSPTPLVAPSASHLQSPVATTPTIDELGRSYLALATTYNATMKAVNRDRNRAVRANHLAAVLRQYKASAIAERTFTDGIRRIVFPAFMAADVRALLSTSSKDEVVQLLAAASRSWSELEKTYPQMRRTNTDATSAANLIRQDLGLKAVPIL